MKRFFTLALVVLMMMSTLIPVSAASGEVLKGTPVVDGALDEMYKQSFHNPRNPDDKGWAFSKVQGPFNFEFETYFLYDDNYFYVCTVVTDDDLFDVGADAYAANPTLWKGEAVEFWFEPDNKELMFKNHADAFGHAFYFGDGTAPFTTVECQKAVKVSADKKSYTVEVAYPMAGVKKLMPNGTLNIKTQANDMQNETQGCALNSKTVPITFSDKAVAVAAPETTKTPTTTAPAQTPATADLSVMVLLAAAICAFGVAAVAKKKH